MDVLYIVIPAYNEEANIAKTAREWHKIALRHAAGGASRLVLVDDGSRDRTGEILAGLSGELPLLRVVSKENGGHSSAVLAGYRYAIAHGADYIFQTDSDGQTLPLEFERFWRRREDFDLVIGWRKHREDGSSRILVTRVLRAVIRVVLRARVLDANTPFRLMKRKGLEENLAFLPEGVSLVNAALAAIYKRRGQKVRFLAITFRPRQGGRNSINLLKIAKLGLAAVRDFRLIDAKLKGKDAQSAVCRFQSKQSCTARCSAPPKAKALRAAVHAASQN